MTSRDIANKKVIEIGAYDVNGSLRPFIISRNPSYYVGIDIIPGPGVDILCSVEDILDKFGKESFDLVLATEVIEHLIDWRKAISNIKQICRSNGIILITTRSRGFKYHGFPYDIWRYETEDIQEIFSDCRIEKLEKDWLEPGVFVKVRKPTQFVEKDLSNYKLYSIVINKKTTTLDESRIINFHQWYSKKQALRKRIHRVIDKFIIF